MCLSGGRTSPHWRSIIGMQVSIGRVAQSSELVSMRSHCCKRALKCSLPQAMPSRETARGQGAPNSPSMITYNQDSRADGKTEPSDEAGSEHSG